MSISHELGCVTMTIPFCKLPLYNGVSVNPCVLAIIIPLYVQDFPEITGKYEMNYGTTQSATFDSYTQMK